MTNRIFQRGTRSKTLSKTRHTMARRVSALMAVALFAAWWTSAAAQQQPAGERSIFRLVTFQTTGDLRLGATQGNGESDVVDIHNAILALKAAGAPEVQNLSYIPADMKSLIEVGDSAVAAVKSVYRAAQNLKTSGRFVEPGGERRVFHPYTAVRLRAPIPNPSKVFGMASNYIEEGSEPAKVPSYFLKSVSAIIGPGEPIVRTSLLEDGGRNTHEPEFAIVIGRRAKNVSEADAMNYVLGYMVHNDVTGRGLVTGRTGTEGSSMTKGMDTFSPFGPYLTLKEDVPDPYNLAIVTRLNGTVFPMPNGHTKNIVHKFPKTVSFLSQIMTLEPGDIIATGVPAPTVPLRAGDTVEITIDRLGTLINPVVATAPGPGS